MTLIYSFLYLYWPYLLVAVSCLVILYLINVKEEADRALAANERFLSTMCHEIRTPLNAVIGMTYLLLQENPKPEQVPNLKTMKFSAEHLLVLINDVLECSKVESGKIVFEEVDFNIRELVNSIRQSHAYKADEKGIQLKVHYDPELPEIVVGDPVRLAQVLNNLVSNAIKFTPKGSVIVDINLDSENKDYSMLEFAVIDTGIGIPQDKIEYIFENFTQASADTTRRFGGTGLGLSIIKQLLKLQNSAIKVESIEGKGSKFYFTLKMKKRTGRAPVYPGTPGSSSYNDMRHEPCSEPVYHGFAGKNIKLLLVEDNEVNQMVANGFLTRWGIEPHYAGNGKIALEKIINEQYDIILLDLQMPEMDGYQVTKAIRSMEGAYFKNVPIIALTASSMLEVRNKVLSIGMNDYVTKPFNPGELYQKISKYLNVNTSTPTTILEHKTFEKTEVHSTNHVINYAKLVKMALGSEELQMELTHIYIDAFERFPADYRSALLNRNIEDLDFVTHKAKPSIKVLETYELEKELLRGMELLREAHAEEHALYANAERVKTLCEEVVRALQNYVPLVMEQ